MKILEKGFNVYIVIVIQLSITLLSINPYAWFPLDRNRIMQSCDLSKF